MVRRRVPERDVDDVIQEVLCDALASDVPATSPRDVARWVMAIARHKIADYHRRSSREPLVGGWPAPGGARFPGPIEPSASDSEVEDRELLALALKEAAREPRGPETLDWIVRELEGETLVEIARRDDVGAAAARQRVSRLRKRLRAALLCAAMLSVVGVAWWSSRDAFEEATPIAIVPEVTAPTQPSPAPAARPAAAPLDGEWHVASLSPATGTLPALDAVMRAQAPSTRIIVSGRDVTIVTPARSVQGTLTLEPTTEAGRFRGHLETTLGSSPIELSVHGDSVTLRATEGRIAGTVELER
jgi:DNA-directed RNA polymerase specialized sigma24 family protein